MSPPVNGSRLSSLKQTNLKARKPQAIDRPEVYPPVSPHQAARRKASCRHCGSRCFRLILWTIAIRLSCHLDALAILVAYAHCPREKAPLL